MVYFKARNSTIESYTSATIMYALRPTGLSLSINDGTEDTASNTVTLMLVATGATEMCFSNDVISWSAWEPYTTIKVWKLPSTAGYKLVYFKVRNGTIESIAPIASGIMYNPGEPVPTWAWVMIFLVILGSSSRRNLGSH
jgi:hypothetical protein